VLVYLKNMPEGTKNLVRRLFNVYAKELMFDERDWEVLFKRIEIIIVDYHAEITKSKWKNIL